MAEQFTTLFDSIGGLCLDDRVTEPTEPFSNGSNTTPQSLVEAVETLIQSCEATSAHAQQVKALIEGTCTPNGQGTVKLSSLRRRATALAGTTKAFSDATERYIIAYILSLAGPGTLVQRMLSHFTGKLRNIARDVLDNTNDDNDVLRETLKMCYSQALHIFGTLHSDNYFDPLGEASLEWPYDPDFESEGYYEHENRLAVDDSYAEAFHAQREHRYEKEEQQREEWIRFWVRALSECPDGPTLFYSPASHQPYCHLADVPRYLFRAFDPKSSGRSDHHVVASAESISLTSRRGRVDLLARTREETTRMLYSHLTKPCFGGEDADNLMSWSSSLLFVIQYAIWRCYLRRCARTEVEICMIDTRKFPRGQFARDKSLLRAYHETPNLDRKTQSFVSFRLDNEDYDNGEYLSQGVLHHTGRSSVASLAQLIQAGLHDLYPEFADPTAVGSWTKRVKFLRTEWSIEYTTTQLDIQKAVEMARACFKSFDAPDVALLLLSFKNRKLRASTTKGSFRDIEKRRRNLCDFGPVEVQRYIEIAETSMSKDQDYLNALRWLSSDSRLLEEVFECS